MKRELPPPLRKLLASFDARAPRERVVVTLGLVAVTLALAQSLVLAPEQSRQQALRRDIADAENEARTISASIDALVKAVDNSPVAVARQRLQEVERRMDEADARIESTRRQLVPAEQMAALLEDLLHRQGRLQLLQMRNLPVEPLLPQAEAGTPSAVDKPVAKPGDGVVDKADGAREDGRQLYRHGVELALQGNYLDVLDYLTRLEGLHWRVQWGELRLDASEHAATRTTLKIYTVSTNKTWLKI